MEKEFKVRHIYSPDDSLSDAVRAYSYPLSVRTFDFTTLWDYVKAECTKILNWPSYPDFKGHAAIQRVMRVYTVVYRLASTQCTDCPKSVHSFDGKEDVLGNGEEGFQRIIIYCFLRDLIHSHLSLVVYPRLLGSTDSNSPSFLEAYLFEWKTFIVAVNHLKMIFSYLHTPWQKFGLPLAHTFLPIDTLALGQWSETIMSEGVCQVLFENISTLSSRDRLHRLSKELSEKLRDVSHSLEALNGLRHTLYLTLVEDPYLAQLQQFYRGEITTMKAGGILLYLERAFLIFEDEADRVIRFFAKSTLDSAMQRLAEVLIDSEIVYLKQHLREWILNNRVPFLNKMYHLLRKSKIGNDALREVFQDAVFDKGVEEIRAMCEHSGKSAGELYRVVLEGVISVYAFFETVMGSFEGDKLLVKAMLSGLARVLVFLPYVKNKQALGEELARLVHEKLKMIDNIGKFETILKRIVTVFQLLPEKKSFLDSYPRHLSMRLLSETYHEENERLAIQKISQAEGYIGGFVHQCKVMLTDITETSLSLRKKFNSVCMDPLGGFGGFDFVPVVITSYSWPDFPRDISLPTPRELSNMMLVFQQFFSQHYPKRNITFAPLFSRGVVKMNLSTECRFQSIDLHLSQCHLLITQCFNTQSDWTVKELFLATDMPDQTLFLRSLGTFLRYGLLEVYDKNGKVKLPLCSVLAVHRVRVVPAPETKRRRLKLYIDHWGFSGLTAGTKNEFLTEHVDASNVVDQAKDPAIQAIIIRVFKSNGVLSFVELMEKIESFSVKEVPSVHQVKTVLEFLISRGFISRSDVNDGKFSYIC